MLLLISPAKTLDFSSQDVCATATRPELLAQSKKLIALLRPFSPKQIGKLMGISDKLAVGVHDHVRLWKNKYDAVGAKQALLAFGGDVYVGLAANDFSPDDFDFSQQHLRILSGLYGVLRPLDLVQPHRLEMGTRLSGDHGVSLYDFWQDGIARKLRRALAEQGDEVLVNLASQEYFKAARAGSFPCRVITPVFKDRKGGQYKVLSFFAKKARGMMTRHIIRNRVTDERGILTFREAGYKYHRGLSSADQPVFARDEARA
ncbi:MAG: peroxide stress protein YaaA [Pirellulales bacterium]|nr:peroxide stress protein YaaA [Pirellulales bacterium]